MTNDWIYEKANALVKKHFTRDPFELAKDLNIHLEVMNNMTHLLGMYQVIQKNRFIFLSGFAQQPSNGFMHQVVLMMQQLFR